MLTAYLSMGIEERAHENAIFHAERQVLRALCQGTPQGPVRTIGILTLKNYRWREAAHAVFFQVLTRSATTSPETLRAQLPALLTRRGFPDVDWEDLFVPHGMTKDEAEDLISRLKNL